MVTALIALVSVAGLADVRADILPGQVTGYSMLGCMINNYSNVPQKVVQVNYQYTCNHRPTGPIQTYFETRGCFGDCLIQPYRSSWQTNGPVTFNCQLIGATCYGIGVPQPTPTPSL